MQISTFELQTSNHRLSQSPLETLYPSERTSCFSIVVTRQGMSSTDIDAIKLTAVLGHLVARTQEHPGAPWRHPGDTQDALRSTEGHPGDTQEAPSSSQETPRRHPGGAQQQPGDTQERREGTQEHPRDTQRHQELQMPLQPRKNGSWKLVLPIMS